ncbi:MAG TPA: hypothetical protein DDZ96_01910 [Porphyromonadaceae bacterium]|jgi:hypothetical protein|nr:hypothetical protein [Porphyromonadaceae bacterium]HBL32560.1 hypothetical protein [Porphyromonadaceae bacterium]HBX19117.1 hypothetical protein [Porphyromonadaceae bacterium]HCM20816.1 hypothetical protein [Porphyromonadaceae bacterium]
MKKISLWILFATILFASCEKEQDMFKLLPADQAKKPVLAAHNAIAITESNMAETTVFKWEKADFGVPTATEYTLYVKIGDGKASNVASAFGDSLSIELEKLNKTLINAGAEANKATDAQFFLEAVYKDYKVSSDAITANVTTFKPLFPDNVYMIGQEFGSWDWGSANVVEMIPVNGNDGKFWAVRYFADANNGFKWNTTKAWGGDFFSLGKDVGFTTKDGNAFVASAGFYIVVVDYTTSTITLEPAQVYGMGDCFGGWNTAQYPFTPQGNVMKITTTNDGELRMYANAAAASVGGDWWRMEFIILGGKIAYRGNGGDQTRVEVKAGKVVTLDFNNGTGTIE